MERTESRIIQVTPAHENDMINLMEKFGYNLQGRQEMHIEGDTSPDLSISASIADAIGSTRSYKTEIKHFVKLHFSRSLSLPDLSKIRELENKYFALDDDWARLSEPEPSVPPLLPGGPVVGCVLAVILMPLVPFYLAYRWHCQRKKASVDPELKRKRQEVIRRQQEILQSLEALTS